MLSSKGTDEDKGAAAPAGTNRNRVVVLGCIAAFAAMGALSFAAVPIYRIYCQKTGFAGTTQLAEKAPDAQLEREITIRFDANVAPGMPWTFEPVVQTMKVRIGENALAFFRASNLAGHAVTGEASFNVAPDIAGPFFSKIQCFCFTQQTLAAGEKVEMPVSFFVDPKIVADPDAHDVPQITLSYTFYPASVPKSAEQSAKGRKQGS